MAYGQTDENLIYGYQTLYREMAYFIKRSEQYERALKYFDEAINLTPNDKRALMGRSCARAKACQYQGALDDINKALSEDPKDLVVLALKALNTYLSCEFEEGLIQNTRLVPLRQKPDNFVMGVMHCTEAIENCVGARAGKPLRDYFKIIRKIAWKKSFAAQKPYEPKSKYSKKKKRRRRIKIQKKDIKEPVAPIKSRKSGKSVDAPPDAEGLEVADNPDLQIRDSLYTHASEVNIIPPYPKPFPFKPLQNYTTNIENYMAEKYLDSMYLDKIFLKNLQFNPGIKSPNKAGAKKVQQLSKYGYKQLCYNQELLRTRRPFYFLKYQEATSTGKLRERQEAELKRLQATAKREADTLVTLIEQYINAKQSRLALDYAEKLKTYCDSKPKKVLPTREDYLNHMYDLVCKAHFIMKRLNKTQYDWDQEKRIYYTLGVPYDNEPSTDSVIEQFKDIFIDWNKMVDLYEQRMRKAITPQEMAWLYHELSRFHSELKQYELSRVYARKCTTEARRCDKPEWIINALMLIAKVNMMQHNKNDAKVELHEAIEVAKGMDNKDLTEYLQRCLDVIDRIDFDGVSGSKVLERREKKIIEMMTGDEMKGEAAFLFRKMSVMPAARRMSVMPGVRLEDTKERIPASARMSIMPRARSDDDIQLDKKDKSKEGKGIAFMDLIQYHVD